jgi:DnaK suppressor protein
MKDTEVEQFKVRLLRLKAELENIENTSKEAAKPVELDQSSVGRLSRMDAMQAQQMAREGARRRQQQLTRLEGALRRIAANEYGYCAVCGEEIDVRRLDADPTATRCIACVDKDY